jgi:hypothetical protein
MSYEPPPYLKKIRTALLRVDSKMNLARYLYGGDVQSARSLEIFEILGTNGALAAPALKELVLNTNYQDRPLYAAVSLGYIGRPGTVALLSILQNKTNRNRTAGAAVFRNCSGPDRDIIEPVLKQCLKDSDAMISISASNALRDLKIADERARVLHGD